MINRRQFLQGAGATGIGLLVGCGRLPGQKPELHPARKAWIGYLVNIPSVSTARYFDVFRQSLQELGYVEGQNLVLEYRSADGDRARLRELATELTMLPVDLIVAAAGASSVRAAQEATNTVPILFPLLQVDPVASGLVASLGHPGGNLTGITSRAGDLDGKRLELLKEAVPALSRVSVLLNPDNPDKLRELRDTQAAAQALGVQVKALEVRARSDIERLLAAAEPERAEGLVLLEDTLINAHRARIAALALQQGLPSIYTVLEFGQEGGLLAYGPDRADQHRRLAKYVDKILKGARPADLPVEQPTTLDFVINLRTAQALGLTIPPHVLLQATEVIP